MGQSRARALGTWGLGRAGGVDLLAKEDEAPKSHIFFPEILVAHLRVEEWQLHKGPRFGCPPHTGESRGL